MGSLLARLLARFSEPSSYAGLGAILALVGFNLPDAELGQVVQFLAAGSGLLAIVLKERGVIKMLAPIAVVAVALTACTTAELQQTQQRAAPYQEQIARLCGVAMTLAPFSGPVAPWILGGCSTEAAVARLALDPSSAEWLGGLIDKARNR